LRGACFGQLYNAAGRDRPHRPTVLLADEPCRNDEAVPHVASSLRRFGWQQPIVARRTGEVVAGNTRLKAAQQLGMTEVPVWWIEGDDLAAMAYNLADNRSHEHSHWNDPELAALLEQLLHRGRHRFGSIPRTRCPPPCGRSGCGWPS
jgi:ParB-like chromosome segregation protein Spo0J